MDAKQLAAERAVELVRDGMKVGLGTGSTASKAIRGIAEKVRQGLRIRAAASSVASEKLATELGIPLMTQEELEPLDLTIDGADEVDSQLNLIKGGGGALLREKLLAANSSRFVVIVDDSKLTGTLGRFPLAVEVIPFAVRLTMARLAELGCRPVLRQKEDGSPFLTDNGNWIADCRFGPIPDPGELAVRLSTIPGVAEHGLFVQMAASVIAASPDGTIRVLGEPLTGG
ncbi:ribose-5-phosphate isomerase A [Paenibacillus sp. J31TS4]|uniref:ribose-5-phosphate isomerase RpiA n=1 Tax=Paenibacillus sp. J31TS4 TaxID=2807195 RepID=UPI001B11AED8|nr:ribose-5-phosphate isomerase RpiA [Paenibacillus sp. J31TS4]GIP37756.1 ribose-5-phosphate isomerase A [Paenibacillus sp. J31TS4]